MRYFFFTLMYCFIPVLCFAEYNCRLDITYKWKPGEEDKEQTVDFSQLAKSADTEEEAKTQLERLVIREKAKAAEKCKRDHQNLSGCVASKFSMMASVHRRLPFSARKSLEKAIEDDCKALQGTCLEAASTDPKCVNLAEEGEEEKE